MSGGLPYLKANLVFLQCRSQNLYRPCQLPLLLHRYQLQQLLLRPLRTPYQKLWRPRQPQSQ